MTDSTKFPRIDKSALSDHGTSVRVERVWQRLEADLGRRKPRVPAVALWAPAAAVAFFAAGVFVGNEWSARSSNQVTAVAHAPEIAAEPGSVSGAPSSVALQHPSAPHAERRNAPAAMSSISRPAAGRVMPQPSQPLLLQSSSSSAPMEWERLANVAEYAAASRALEDAGGFEAALSRASAEQAMLLHDIARFSGQRARAIQALRHVVSEHPGDPYAPTAAYTLGNMLENAGDQAGAAEAFAIYRRLAPKGDFVEDALTRQLDVAIQQRDVELARRLVDQYASEFPNGRRLGEMRRRVAGLGSSAGVVPSADGARSVPEGQPFQESVDDEPGTRGADR